MRLILETPRLALREMSLRDLDFIATMLADPQVMQYYPKTHDRAESAGWIERQIRRYERDGHGLWLAIEQATGDPIGQIGLVTQHVDGNELPEIGYLVHRRFWRRGFASEAAAGVRDFAFDRLGRQRIISLIRPENLPSQGVARKIGMVPWRETTRADWKHLVYSMTMPGGQAIG